MNTGDLIAVAITIVFFVGDIVLGFWVFTEGRIRRARADELQKQLEPLWSQLLPVLDRSETGQRTTEEWLVIRLIGVINGEIEWLDGSRRRPAGRPRT